MHASDRTHCTINIYICQYVYAKNSPFHLPKSDRCARLHCTGGKGADRVFLWGTTLGMGFVLFTFLGVNALFSGLHSYI